MVTLLRRWRHAGVSWRPQMQTYMLSQSRAMSTKLFVGGLSFRVDEEMLRKAFEEHGQVVDVRIIKDRESGQSRGFGFVTFGQESEAEVAKSKMGSSYLLDGRYIRVDMASDRASSPALPRSSSSSFGNSSSPSGFSFGRAGTRPPVVEDWGGITSYSNGYGQKNINSSSVPQTSENRALGHNYGLRDMNSSSAAVVENRDLASNGQGSSSQFNNGSFGMSTPSTTSSFGAESSVLSMSSSSADTSVGMESSPGTNQNSSASSLNWSSSFANTSAGMESSQQLANQSNAASSLNQSALSGSNSASTFNSSLSPNMPQTSSSSGVEGSLPGALQGIEASLSKLMQPDASSSSSSTSSNTSQSYDFRNLPELKSSAYQGYKRPYEMDKPKGRVVLQSTPEVTVFQKKLTVESIPSFKGAPFDFGLAGMPSAPPPLESGAKPHGGFDINIDFDKIIEDPDEDSQPYSFFTHRTLPPLDLPWDTPEADNWSEIGKEPRRIEDSPYSPFSSDLKDDPEFWWDPFDFDEEARLPKEPEVEQQSANAAA